MLLHLIIVRLIREWQGAPATWNPIDRLVAMAGGVVGACTFAVTDSFWFNAVEAEGLRSFNAFHGTCCLADPKVAEKRLLSKRSALQADSTGLD